ncbi:MAG: hypothetical protein GF390_02900, partial [Candidatus Pacebacteria bacterium]|nr:hypothetical protein [Candidatus Paceibacterota bacterium]
MWEKLFSQLQQLGQRLNSADLILVGLIFCLGLGLRLYPGQDHFSWIYDQARDQYIIRSIFEQGNLVLVGPQTDYPGLSHGPLSYYLLAPAYFFSQGDPNLPGLVMILVNLSTLLPLALLVQYLFQDKKITWLSLLLFVLAYEQIEYA